MLRDDIRSIILDRMFDLGNGFIDSSDLPDILADEIMLLIEKPGKTVVISCNGQTVSYTPMDRHSEDRLRKILKNSNIGFAETDDAILIGKTV